MFKESIIKYLSLLVLLFASSLGIAEEQKIVGEKESALMAGFITAHAIYSIYEGETLIPIHAYRGSDQKNNLIRLTNENLEEAVSLGRKSMEENTYEADIAVLAYDGYIPLDDGKYDSIFIEFADYSNMSEFTLAIPYKSKTPDNPFVVYKPKLLKLPDDSSNRLSAVMEAFCEGVQSHEQGSKIWNESIDQTK
ncbi:MAG: hypothetical protein ACI978_002714 [Oleispira sp.]|jgi:hypothetical protein